MSLEMRLGGRGNLLAPGPDTYRQVLLNSPILLEGQMAAIAADTTLGSRTFQLSFAAGKAGAMAAALSALCAEVEAAVRAGCQCVVLSDRAAHGEGLSPDTVPIPSLLATGAVHHHLIRTGVPCPVCLLIFSFFCLCLFIFLWHATLCHQAAFFGRRLANANISLHPSFPSPSQTCLTLVPRSPALL